MLKIKRFSTNTVDSLKDFNQEDVHRFMKYCGRDLYENESYSSVPNNVKLSSLRHGKFKPSALPKSVKILFPANNREYISNGLIEVYDGTSSIENYLDVFVTIDNGLMIFQDADYYVPLVGILPKYHTSSSTWHYRFVKKNMISPAKPVITVPTNERDWVELYKVFTEFLVFLKLFIGAEFKMYLTTKPISKQKNYSDINDSNSPASFIPTIINLGYSMIGYPMIMGKLSKKLNEVSKRDNSNYKLQKKIIDYCKKTYQKNILFVNLGKGSCFLNPQNIKNISTLKKIADSKRLRTMLDWVLYGYEQKKMVIFYSDLDSPTALAHEVGHALIELDGTIGKIQRHDQKGIFSNSFAGFFAFVAGIFGPIGEIAGVAGAMLLKSPQLYIEYLASYKGYEILKTIGLTEDELKRAKNYYKLAFKTYLATTSAVATIGAGTGRGYGRGIKLILKNK